MILLIPALAPELLRRQMRDDVLPSANALLVPPEGISDAEAIRPSGALDAKTAVLGKCQFLHSVRHGAIAMVAVGTNGGKGNDVMGRLRRGGESADARLWGMTCLLKGKN